MRVLLVALIFAFTGCGDAPLLVNPESVAMMGEQSAKGPPPCKGWRKHDPGCSEPESDPPEDPEPEPPPEEPEPEPDPPDDPEPDPDPTFDVAIEPGQSIQQAVNANPEGTVFLIRSGVHTGQQVTPKDDQVFRCEAGAVLDGQGAPFAFGSYGIPGHRVTIDGCEITGYGGTENYHGAVQGFNGDDWTLTGNAIHDNDEAGIQSGSGFQITGNLIYRNGEMGVGGFQNADILVEGNEITENGATGAGGNAAGLKFVDSRRPVIRGNAVSRNFGRGIWLDTEIYDATIENNQAHDNTLEGIWLEAGCGGGLIRGNQVSGNGFGMALQAWPDRAGIQVSNASGVLVEGNTVEDNQNGIALYDATGYPAHACGRSTLRNVTVRNNHVRQSNAGAAAAAVDNSGIVDYSGIVFEGNTYELGSDAVFRWQSTQAMSLSQWQAAGNQ